MLQVCEMASIVTQADIDLTRKMDQAKMTAFEEAVAGITFQLSERCGAFNGELFSKMLSTSRDVQHFHIHQSTPLIGAICVPSPSFLRLQPCSAELHIC